MTETGTAPGILTIDLDAIAGNFRTLRAKLGRGAACSAVVKADAYGLGMERVAPVLEKAGCDTFFIALSEEGLSLRVLLPGALIYVFEGCPAGLEETYAKNRLRPVLNSLEDIGRWDDFCSKVDHPHPAAIHFDTGMARLGLTEKETKTLIGDRGLLRHMETALIMSHLACADIADHAKNTAQRDAFQTIARAFPGVPASLANSSAVFLGPDYHADIARPGAALYGVNPTPGAPNPMAQVVRLQGKILQVREIDRTLSVGYGATRHVDRGALLATLGLGYADGYPRVLSDTGAAYLGDIRLPILGRISMDLITIDVSGLEPGQVRPGMYLDLIGPEVGIDRLARQAGTIGYEILTSLGRRARHDYISGGAVC